MGFGFEAIHTTEKRDALLLAILNYFRGITSVEPTSDGTIPSGFALAQNYPNPFNPTTIIQFALPGEAWVTLKIYNVLGSEVAALVDDVESVGSHRVEFNGAEIPSGVYLCKLRTEAGTEMRKMLPPPRPTTSARSASVTSSRSSTLIGPTRA